MEECITKQVISVGNWSLLRNSGKEHMPVSDGCHVRCEEDYSDKYFCHLLVEASSRVRHNTEWTLTSR